MTDRQTAIPRRLLCSAGGFALLSGCGASGSRHPVSAARTEASPPVVRARAQDQAQDRAPVRAAAAAAGTPGKPDYFVHAGPKALALTFDDGPGPVYTGQVLALLRRHGVKATFFLIGENVESYPDVVRQILGDGHLVGNHTWSHPDLGRLSRSRIREEIERTGELIARVGGMRPPTVFRAPGGFFPSASLEICGELGLRPVSWSVDPEDWSNPGTDVIIDRVLRRARTGSIVLEHDGCLAAPPIDPGSPADRSQTVAALADYLPRLIDAGYRFTTVAPVS